MNTLKADYQVEELAHALEVTSSGFYAHQHKPEGARRQQDQKLLKRIQPIFKESRSTYGSPRIHAALKRQGEPCSKNRVARLMRQNHLRARQKRRFVPRTTQSDHDLPIAPNWLAKVPTPDRPNRVWVVDITYIATAEGWTYLAVVLDACSRKVVGWSMASSLETFLVTEALARAQKERLPQPGLLHHSDRGVQYASSAYRALLADYQITPSMSRAANPYDNALAESFMATLKTECFDKPPNTHGEAKLMIFDYLETFYNSKRLHSALGYQSPVEFENQFS
ncbi:IS3 family transposase [Pedosphaera parvula]|uniref:Integrase catalytic region n=1 Tax=Pedosphaera parvula (strain Ellin514) TaxID=320771 RepID=B9XEB0_PEDPL|nr:IS3 family transposase [Pedosphaera parvula]EEF60713.1 Integrase catalytic region [Pedosphaera parvula Ellin514]EEF62001.1 Integrase catalytic region [Pedosphaera parvula Ellin514]